MRLAGIFLVGSLLFFMGCTSAQTKATAPEPVVNQEKAATEPEKMKPIAINEFMLGAGDTIEINVYRNEDMKRTLKVDPSGKIMFPLIGDVQVAGKSIFTVRDEMKASLSKFLIDPEVTINVTTVQSRKLIVLGEVKNPGVFSLDSDISVTEAVSRAGGATNDAKLKNVILIRKTGGKSTATAVDVDKVLDGGDVMADVALQSGDIVFVPSKTIADVSRYFNYISSILSPIVNLETGIVLWPGVKEVLSGNKSSSTLIAR